MFQLIQFNQKPDDSGANQEDAGSSFIPLGEAMEAVILRLSTELPRIRVRAPIWEEGNRSPR